MEEHDKIQDLFTPSGCLSFDGLERYIERKLDDGEQKLADLHINSCELCSDAVKGYQKQSSPASAVSGVNDLNRMLSQRFLTVHIRKKKERSLVSVFSIAATLILVIGLFFLLKQREMYTRKTISEVRHDSVMVPGKQTLQPFIVPERETSPSPVRAPLIQRKERSKKPEYAGPLSMDKKDMREKIETVIRDEVVIAGVEAEINQPEEIVVEIMTDSITVSVTKAKKANRASPSAASVLAGKKSTGAGYEAVSAGQVALKSDNMQEEAVYSRVDVMPLFMEGDISRFLQYIRDNLVYPSEAIGAGIEGKVMIHFVVNELGKITDTRVIHSCDSLLDAEAIRVVESSPLWKAGVQDGKPVKVSYTVPIVFSMEGN
jgi:TonB family protein